MDTLMQAQAPSPYPTWDDLCQSFSGPYKNQEFLKAVDQIKSNPPDVRYRIARFLIINIFRDEVYQKFLKCSWTEIVDMLADQVARNRDIRSGEETMSGSRPLALRTNSRFSRPYSQMPCTQSTARRRVEKALTLVNKDDPVLLLGDDDLVSVELALAGFTNITALDIDLKVLEEIQRSCETHQVRVKLYQHDLALPPPQHLISDYKMVFFDPEYSIRGANLFLNAGLELTQHSKNTLYFMSIHLMSLMREGLQELEDLFSRTGLELSEFAQGFNAYPAPSRLKSLIHLVNQILIGSKTLTTEGYSFPFLLSDALILRKSQ
jgi:hypothetical protein